MILGVICEHTMGLGVIVDLLRPISVDGQPNLEISGIAYDSRRVSAGMLFVAICGDNCDGNRFIDEAIERGAVAIVSECAELGRRDAVHIHVYSARQALAEIAAHFYSYPSGNLTTIGITGTNGKTTTAFMLRDILTRTGLRPGLVSTVSYEIGNRSLPADRTTPESLDLQSMLSKMVSAECLSVIMEVSSHALVQKRVWGVDFDIGVFTNLTQDHLDYHDSMEQYFAAKSLLFNGSHKTEKPLTAVVNVDDQWGERLLAAGGNWAQTITFGENSTAMVRADNIVEGEQGSSFRVISPAGHCEVQLPAIGRFNISNALAAIAVTVALKLDLEAVVSALREFRSAPGRLEEIDNDCGFRVFVDYAHTDDALRSVLATLRRIAEGNIITVFGCGGNRDKEKRALMGKVAAQFSDHSVITSDNPRKEHATDIIQQIEMGFQGNHSYAVVEDRESAIATALEFARPGDIVLIAGKGHEKYQEFADTIIPFDDCEVVRSLLENLES